jgi:hypothetical protein
MDFLPTLRARAATVNQACRAHKVEPDMITAAALTYLALKILKLPADEIMAHGPIAHHIQRVFEGLRVAGEASTGSTDPNDPNGKVTMTNAEFALLMNSFNTSKIGNS